MYIHTEREREREIDYQRTTLGRSDEVSPVTSSILKPHIQWLQDTPCLCSRVKGGMAIHLTHLSPRTEFAASAFLYSSVYSL